MEIDEIASELSKGKIRPVYLLVGAEAYRLDQALQAIKSAALDAAAAIFNYEVFHGAESSAVHILAAARTPPMMGNRRLLIVRGVDDLEPAEQDALAPYIVDPNPTTTLVLVASKLDGRRKLASAAKKQDAMAEASAIAERQIPAWAARLARSLGHSLEPAAASALVECAGSELYVIDDALQRLSLYVGEGKPITAADVAACIAPLRSGSVFELIDAVGRRQAQRALAILGQLLDVREPALRILWWISRHLRQLVVAREIDRRQLPQRLGVPPFVADKLADQARGFSAEMLARALDVLAETDLDLKGSKRSERLVLEEAVLRLCG